MRQLSRCHTAVEGFHALDYVPSHVGVRHPHQAPYETSHTLSMYFLQSAFLYGSFKMQNMNCKTELIYIINSQLTVIKANLCTHVREKLDDILGVGELIRRFLLQEGKPVTMQNHHTDIWTSKTAPFLLFLNDLIIYMSYLQI